MELSLIRPEDFKKVPWKNGRGVTNELAVYYSEGDDRFLWRISIAGVTENGSFSDFSGYDRTLLMLTGNGIRLEHSDGTENNIGNYNDIAYFSGDLKTSAVLTDGPIKDFNVMVLRDKCRSATRILNSGDEFEITGGDEALLYARPDAVEIKLKNEANKNFVIPPNNLLKIKALIKTRVSVQKGEIIAVRIKYL
jgi:uncharacterized protein